MRAGPSGVIFAMWLVLSTMGPAVATGQQTTAKEQSPQGNEAKGAASTSEAAGVRTPLARPRSWKSLAGDFLTGQKDIWTSPKRIRPTDAEWLIPFAGVTAGLIRTDRTFSAHLKQEPATIQHYRHLADVSVAALGGAGAGMFFWSAVSRSEHQRETGFLSGAAAVNSLAVVEMLKLATQRERPYQGTGTGSFWGGGSSFPSEHAAAAWSIAGVIAHEYPGPLPKLLSYGLATLVSFSRVRSRDHFPSDVAVGSGLGWLISQQVYSRRHDPELGGGEWLSWSAVTKTLQTSRPENFGSPYVPLDSWIYPALDRLAGLGLIETGFAGMRPWTRRECARLVTEAASQLTDPDENPPAAELVERLEREFRPEAKATEEQHAANFRLESVYTRVGRIAGEPLNDGYHF